MKEALTDILFYLTLAGLIIVVGHFTIGLMIGLLFQL
jgi:hypothetical protein